MQKHRIYTNIGRDQKINVEIKQDFDIMEILSLKFTQKDIYASGTCSEYGVVVGRISANNGYGIPNAKVSIFIPQSEIDVDDPVISALYPYTSITDKDEEGYRYNLLPQRQQHAGHNPTGTFMDQRDILTREECLEVFEKYYSFTVKTNSSGDFMIWGVPVGTQTLHVDIDLSDIGCFSLRPYDFIKKGYGVDEFERVYKFKSSSDIDGLPQIVSFDKTIDVYPFWGNEELCEIGITRSDFDLSERNITIEPISLVLASAVTDDNSDSVKRNGRIRVKSGYKCNLQTLGGSVECVRYTGRSVYGSDGITQYPELEFFNITETIDENGAAMIVLPMNMEYVYTNEFGEEEITNDPNKGIPTTTIARFRMNLDFESHKHAVASYLVPNIREFNPNPSGVHSRDEYSEAMLSSYQFSDVFEDYITVNHPITGETLDTTGYDNTVKEHKKELILGTNNNGIPEDYFYKFIYGKVYTVSSFQGTHYETARRDAFLGVKQIRPNVEEDCASSTNYFPTNFAFRNRIKFNLLLGQVLLFVQFIYSVILIKFAEVIGAFFYDAAQLFYDIYFGWPFKWRPFHKFSEKLKDIAYKIQDRFTQQLALTIYPDCEECSTDDEAIIDINSFDNNYCRSAEINLKVVNGQDISLVYTGWVFLVADDDLPSIHFSNSTATGSTFLDKTFYGESARDETGLCSLQDEFEYYSISGMSDHTISVESGYDARYIGEVYSRPEPGDEVVSGSTSFTNFLIYFGTGGTLNEREFIHGSLGSFDPALYLRYTWEEWNVLTGLNYESEEIDDSDTWAVIRVYDRKFARVPSTTGSTMNIESGCEKYDKTYNETIVFNYLWSTGSTYGSTLTPTNPPINYPAGMTEASTNPGGYNLLSTIIGRFGSTQRLPVSVQWSKIPDTSYDRRTKSGLSEFRDGVFTIIPVVQGTSRNLPALQEWYKRKRVGLFFCGGVVNFSFIDNWLNGILYFFKFDKRVKWDNESVYDLNQRVSKYPRELIFYHVFDKKFYYRSCPYYENIFTGQTFNGNQEILHPTTFYDVGARDEFISEICTDARIDPTCSVIRDITNTSYQDPANILEFAINYRLDITSAKFDIGDFFDGDDFGPENIKIFDGDITQLFAINCEAGIEAFDLDGSHYFMYNGEFMDPEDPYFDSYFKLTGTTQYGPTPIDLKLDFNGAFIRGCLNSRLGDYSQKVPFYLWDKGSTILNGFGPYGSGSDNQHWDRTSIATKPLQRLFSISGTTDPDTPNYVMADGEEEYLLMPMTTTHKTFSVTGSTEDMLERFEVIDYGSPSTTSGDAVEYIEGNLWLEVTSGTLKDPITGNIYVVINKTWTLQSDTYEDGYRETFVPQTIKNYSGEKQVLSTPFLFYFGLTPGKTSVDILTKYFGPKGAFTYEEE